MPSAKWQWISKYRKRRCAHGGFTGNWLVVGQDVPKIIALWILKDFDSSLGFPGEGWTKDIRRKLSLRWRDLKDYSLRAYAKALKSFALFCVEAEGLFVGGSGGRQPPQVFVVNRTLPLRIILLGECLPLN